MFGWITRRSIERSIERILLSYVVDCHTEVQKRMQPFPPVEGTFRTSHPTLKARQAYRQSLREKTLGHLIYQPIPAFGYSRMSILRERESAKLDKAFEKRPLLYASVVCGYMPNLFSMEYSHQSPRRPDSFEEDVVKSYCTDYRPLRQVASELGQRYGTKISGDRMRKIARQRLGENLTRRNKEAFTAYQKAYREERS